MILNFLGLFNRQKVDGQEVPLDGSQRARLTNMRVRRDSREERPAPACADLLTRLRRVGGGFSEQRQSNNRIRVQWILSEQSLFNDRVMAGQAIANFQQSIQVSPDLGAALDRSTNARF